MPRNKHVSDMTRIEDAAKRGRECRKAASYLKKYTDILHNTTGGAAEVAYMAVSDKYDVYQHGRFPGEVSGSRTGIDRVVARLGYEPTIPLRKVKVASRGFEFERMEVAELVNLDIEATERLLVVRNEEARRANN